MAVTTPAKWQSLQKVSVMLQLYAAMDSGSLRAPIAVTHDTKQKLQINESCHHRFLQTSRHPHRLAFISQSWKEHLVLGTRHILAHSGIDVPHSFLSQT